ncbi:hypothetical protein [Janthinobacterium sp. BJB426]|uniref:hypothetical protein n=1 Tax=Janthinobacterium sp. BJB426 TaxID=2048010 RepID=UPI0013050B8D|nr:hypothetical protein [Janthinobacterium sp. BJB426]
MKGNTGSAQHASQETLSHSGNKALAKKGSTPLLYFPHPDTIGITASALILCLRRECAWQSRCPFYWHKPGGIPLCTRPILTTNTILFAYSVEMDMNSCHWKMA